MSYPNTLDGLARAQANLEQLEERDSSDTSGNLDKYHTRINQARAEVRRITEDLKRKGVLPYTDIEILGQKLDAVYPNAAAGRKIIFEGKRYIRRARPLSRSRSGKTVYSWDNWWDCLGEASEHDERVAEQERLNQLLDLEFPNASSRMTVTYQGKKYRKRYAPATMSKTGKTVKEWLAWWEKL